MKTFYTETFSPFWWHMQKVARTYSRRTDISRREVLVAYVNATAETPIHNTVALVSPNWLRCCSHILVNMRSGKLMRFAFNALFFVDASEEVLKIMRLIEACQQHC